MTPYDIFIPVPTRIRRFMSKWLRALQSAWLYLRSDDFERAYRQLVFYVDHHSLRELGTSVVIEETELPLGSMEFLDEVKTETEILADFKVHWKERSWLNSLFDNFFYFIDFPRCMKVP